MKQKETRTINIGDYENKIGVSKDYTIIVNNLLQDLKGVKGDTIISFPKGTYHFYPDHAPKREFHTSNTDTRNHPMKQVCFLIEELENVTIEGNGSLFIFHGHVMGVGIFHSKNIQLQNLSWDYEVPTLSELIVQRTEEEQGNIYADYKIGENIPYEISEDQQSFYWLSEESPYSKELYWKDEGSKNHMVIVGYDEASGVKRRHEVNHGPFASHKIRIEEREKGIVRIYYDQALPAEVIPNRVFEFCKVTDRNTAGALIWESENISLTNVTIHYLHGFGLLVQMSGDVSFRKTQFVPNTAAGKHGSSFADSIHVSGAKGKILIDGCTFRHPHDDPINIHGTFTRVQKKMNDHTLEVVYAHRQQSGFPQYHLGNKVVFFNRSTMGEDFPDEYEVTKVVHPGQAGNDLQTMQVTLDKSLPFDTLENGNGEYIYVMENVTYTPEVVITNNYFAQVPTRGILCTTRRKVLIEGNHFENIAMSPIFISNDSNDWYESGPVRDMMIRGNTFYVTHIEGMNHRKPAIYIHPIPLGGKVSPAPIHKNITIENNVFYMNHEYVVSAENVDHLIIKNNKVINIDHDRDGNETLATEYHQKYNSEHAVLFEFDTCENVLIEGNTYHDFTTYARMNRMKKSDLIIKDEQTVIIEEMGDDQMEYLSYQQAANTWTEALPLGNGRIGAMHFGGVETDRFQLNEDTLWSGPPKKDKQYDDRESLQKVRKLIDEKNYEEAISETKNMFGPYTQAYMPLGNLMIDYLHGDIAQKYERRLDINQATSSVKYTVGKVDYTREAFISHPHQVLAIQIASSVEKKLNVAITLDSLLKYRTENAGNEVILQGVCPEICAPIYFHNHEQPIIYGEFGETQAIHFEGRLGIVADGEVASDNGILSIRHASKATLYLSVATSFNGFDQLPGRDFAALTKRNEAILAEAMGISYEQLKALHIQDYQSLFKRVAFTLEDKKSENQTMKVQLDTLLKATGISYDELKALHIEDLQDFLRHVESTSEDKTVEEQIDTDVRVMMHGAEDLGMVALLFQYGRYLMIASSREGTQPANLQGIWNDSTRAPWSSNYTLNINAEMNYWPAEVTNLAECHRPFLKAIQELSINGEKMVHERYGLNGWTAHHNTDLWRHAEPVGDDRHGDPNWAFWPMSGPWLCRHLWEHYTYSLDKEYLKEEAFPLMKGAAMFCLDWLIEDENGYLITSPSTSPEHHFIADHGQEGSVTKGATMDLQVIWDLFTNCIEAASVLDVDDEWIQQVKVAKSRLHPLQIGKYGQLQEWLIDYEDVEPHHRHVSHLYGLYPGKQIIGGPLLEAVEQTLNRRGDEGTGWSLGWKICLWARLKDGERVRELFDQLFNIVSEKGEVMVGGGLYPNLLGAHPPFQIDGNFGYTAGVAEMIIQSHKGYVELLPALPSTWLTGALTGARIQGGFEVNISWDNLQVSELEVTCLVENLLTIKLANSVIIREEGKEDKRIKPVDGMVTMKMNKNQKVQFFF